MKKLIITVIAVSSLMMPTACGGPSSSTSTNNNGKDSIASAPLAKENHMFLMDLEMGGNPKQLISILRQRGFTDGSGFSDDENMVFLRGEVYGKMSELTIDTKGGKVNSVTVTYDLDTNHTQKQAAKRSQDLMEKLAEQYRAEWETICEGYNELKLPYGKASCSFADGCAAGYEVVLSIMDSIETE